MDKTGQRLFSPLRTQPNTGLPGLGHPQGPWGWDSKDLKDGIALKPFSEILRDFKSAKGFMCMHVQLDR